MLPCCSSAVTDSTMPAMNLHFLKNTGRAAAASGKLLRNVEAVVRYGTPAQRVKAVKKILEDAGPLSSNEVTAHVVQSVCECCDNTTRVELLFSLRKVLIDLTRQRAGGRIVMALLEKLPARNRVELATSLLPELSLLASHKVASHVVRKMMTQPSTLEVIQPALLEAFPMLAAHEVGQFAAAAFVEAAPAAVVPLVTTTLLTTIVETLTESEVLCAIVRSTAFDDATVRKRVRTCITSHLDAWVGEGHHNLLLAAACEKGGDDLRQAVLKALLPTLKECIVTKGRVGVCIALATHGAAPERKVVVDALISSFDTATDAAVHPYGSTLLRAVMDADFSSIPLPFVASLTSAAAALAVVPPGSVVVQRLLRCSAPNVSKACFKCLAQADMLALCQDPSGAYVVQAMLDVWETQSDAASRASCLATIADNIATLIVHAQGTHIVQKAVDLMDDETVSTIVTTHVNELQHWAMDRYGCFSMRALLQSLVRRQLVEPRRMTMAVLKNIVAALARSPWAGHIVLEAMLDAASDELKTAIRDVVFLKCEDYLVSPKDAVRDGYEFKPKETPAEEAPAPKAPKSKEAPVKRLKESAKPKEAAAAPKKVKLGEKRSRSARSE